MGGSHVLEMRRLEKASLSSIELQDLATTTMNDEVMMTSSDEFVVKLVDYRKAKRNSCRLTEENHHPLLTLLPRNSFQMLWQLIIGW